MILLWGLMEDETMRSVHDWLQRRGADVWFVNHAAIDQTSVCLSASGEVSYQLSVAGRSQCLQDVSGAYLRPYDYRDYEAALGRGARGAAERVHHLLNVWAEFAEGKIINRPSGEATNHSKLRQAVQISESGFLVPDSLVTNDPVCIREFEARHGRLVYKSMSSVRSVVREFSCDLLTGREIGPVLVQQLLDGSNVRVHVVGNDVFACRVRSEGIDYRYAPARITLCTLPDEVAQRCIAVTRALGLLVSGIDLIVSTSEQWYCLEVNPNPAFSVFESPTEPAIAPAVARLLAD